MNKSHSKHPDFEQPLEREVLSETLAGMCRALSENNEMYGGQVKFDGLVIGKNRRYSVKNMWVYGSYARGALKCANLNILIEFSEPFSAMDGNSIYLQQLPSIFGKLKRVFYTSGTPESVTAAIPAVEPKLIWSADDKDAWQERLSSIDVNATALRPCRITDIVPLRLNQVYPGQQDKYAYYQELQKSIEEGSLDSKFIPLSEISPASQLIDETLVETCKKAWGQVSKARLALLPYAVAYIDKKLAQMGISVIGDYKAGPGYVIEKNGVLAVIAPKELWFPHSVLAGENLAVGTIPELNTQGPNGVWDVTVGHANEVVSQLKEASFWALVEDNLTMGYYNGNSVSGDEGGVLTLELSTNKKNAQDDLSGSSMPETEQSITKLTPLQLLWAINEFDLIEVVGQGAVAFTEEAMNNHWERPLNTNFKGSRIERFLNHFHKA